MGNCQSDWRVFSDFGDLEHVCNLLKEHAADSTSEIGIFQTLLDRIDIQWDEQEKELESKSPGLFARTYLPSGYQAASSLIEAICKNHTVLNNHLPALELLLHKIYIYSLITPDEVDKLRKLTTEKSVKLQKIETGPSSRGDAKDMRRFIDWVKKNDIRVSNITELTQGNYSDWPLEKVYVIETIKKWYKKAMPDQKLKGGRPKIQT